MTRREVYYANLNPARGSEQKGLRPVVIVQADFVASFTQTVVIVPFTTNMNRARLLTCVFVPKDEGGLREDSVALCHHVRAIDSSRLSDYWGKLSEEYTARIDAALALTLGH